MPLNLFGLFRSRFPPVAPEVVDLSDIDVSGESAFQHNFERIVGRRTRDGFDLDVEAQFDPRGGGRPNDVAVAVLVNGKQVGLLLGDSARKYREALGDRCASCRARIVGGWDRGEFDNGYFGLRIDP